MKKENKMIKSLPNCITTEQLLFLSALVINLDGKGFVEISDQDDYIKLNLSCKDGRIIKSTFSLQIVDKYLNRVLKFIDDIL